MAKPIFIITYPESYSMSLTLDSMRDLAERLSDYHVMGNIDESLSTIKYQCFNAPNIPDITIEEICEILKIDYKKGLFL